MNRAPLSPVTAEHIETYRRDGVVLVRNMLDADWIAKMQGAIAEVMADPAAHGILGPSHGAMTSVCFMSRKPGAFRDYVFDSPIAEVTGRVIGAVRATRTTGSTTAAATHSTAAAWTRWRHRVHVDARAVVGHRRASRRNTLWRKNRGRLGLWVGRHHAQCINSTIGVLAP